MIVMLRSGDPLKVHLVGKGPSLRGQDGLYSQPKYGRAKLIRLLHEHSYVEVAAAADVYCKPA